MPTVSVIIPTHNRPTLLERALGSVDNQSYQDFEIIVVNDGEIPVGSIVKRYEKASLILMDEIDSGPSAARNKGIEASSGDYVIFLDDDDIVFPNHLKVLVEAMEAGAEFAYTNAYAWKEDEKLFPRPFIEYSKEVLKHGNIVPVMCAMIKRYLLDDDMFDEELISHEDWDLFLRLSERVEFVHLPYYTAAYSKRSDSDQITNRDYHINYLWKVRGMRGLMNLPPLPDRYSGDCDALALQDFVITLDGRTIRLKKGDYQKMPAERAKELSRAGYVSY